MSETLQDKVAHLIPELNMLAFSPGFIDVEDTEVARSFYEKWQAVNADCITARHEDSKGHLSFVAEQLLSLLSSFPVDETRCGVIEVFPPQTIGSSFLFGGYMTKLESIARSST